MEPAPTRSELIMKHSIHNVEHSGCPTILAVVVFFLTALILSVYIAYTGLILAEVRISHATGECVEVIPPSAGTCATLPARYAITWTR